MSDYKFTNIQKGGALTHDQLAYWQLQETKRANNETARSNKARETETNRANLAHEAETKRHNIMSEILTSRQIAETTRHNFTSEIIALNQQNEVQRANRANEALKLAQVNLGYSQVGLGYAQLHETQRSNITRETQNLMSLNETIRSNMARENNTRFLNIASTTETHRANIASEALKAEANRVSLINAQTSIQNMLENRRSNLAQEYNTKRGQNLNFASNLLSSLARLATSNKSTTTNRR